MSIRPVVASSFGIARRRERRRGGKPLKAENR
jgi:hypothetical protein